MHGPLRDIDVLSSCSCKPQARLRTMLTWAGWLGWAALLPSIVFFSGDEASCRGRPVRETRPAFAAVRPLSRASLMLLGRIKHRAKSQASLSCRFAHGSASALPSPALAHAAQQAAGMGSRPGSTRAGSHLAASAAVGRGGHHSPGAGPRIVAGRGRLHALVLVLRGAHLPRPGSALVQVVEQRNFGSRTTGCLVWSLLGVSFALILRIRSEYVVLE